MNTLSISIKEIGDFEILQENTIFIENQINLKMQAIFDDEYYKIREKIDQMRDAIRQRLLKKHFPERSQDSFTPEEEDELENFFEKDISEEKIIYQNLIMTFYRNRFFVEFPLICVSKPQGFDIAKITDPEVFNKIFSMVLDARGEAGRKKKD